MYAWTGSEYGIWRRRALAIWVSAMTPRDRRRLTVRDWTTYATIALMAAGLLYTMSRDKSSDVVANATTIGQLQQAVADLRQEVSDVEAAETSYHGSFTRPPKGH